MHLGDVTNPNVGHGDSVGLNEGTRAMLVDGSYRRAAPTEETGASINHSGPPQGSSVGCLCDDPCLPDQISRRRPTLAPPEHERPPNRGSGDDGGQHQNATDKDCSFDCPEAFRTPFLNVSTRHSCSSTSFASAQKEWAPTKAFPPIAPHY